VAAADGPLDAGIADYASALTDRGLTTVRRYAA
jgi:hypothetical protein